MKEWGSYGWREWEDGGGGVLALVSRVLWLVGAVVEASFKQLNGDDGEDELEQHVDDHDVDDVLERVHHTVEHRLTTPAPLQ